MGSLLIFHLKVCPHDEVHCDGDSYDEKSSRLPWCLRCGDNLQWSDLNERYEEQP